MLHTVELSKLTSRSAEGYCEYNWLCIWKWWGIFQEKYGSKMLSFPHKEHLFHYMSTTEHYLQNNIKNSYVILHYNTIQSPWVTIFLWKNVFRVLSWNWKYLSRGRKAQWETWVLDSKNLNFNPGTVNTTFITLSKLLNWGSVSQCKKEIMVFTSQVVLWIKWSYRTLPGTQ